jgi:hypothetical protein
MWRPACGLADRMSGGRTRGSQLGSVAGNREAGPRPWGVSPPSRAARLSSGSRRSACWRESDGQKTPRRAPVKRPHFFRGVPHGASRAPANPWPSVRGTRTEGHDPERKPLAGTKEYACIPSMSSPATAAKPWSGRGPSKRRPRSSCRAGVYWMPAAAGMTTVGGRDRLRGARPGSGGEATAPLTC